MAIAKWYLMYCNLKVNNNPYCILLANTCPQILRIHYNYSHKQHPWINASTCIYMSCPQNTRNSMQLALYDIGCLLHLKLKCIPYICCWSSLQRFTSHPCIRSSHLGIGNCMWSRKTGSVEDVSCIIRGAWDLFLCFRIFYAQALVD